MKKETLKKANELLKRIELLEISNTNYVSSSNQNDPGFDDENFPHNREITLKLSVSDAEDYQKHCDRFRKKLLNKLQSEFDSLK